MNTLEVAVGDRLYREFFERDCEGKIRSGDRATDYLLDLPLSIIGKMPEKEFSVATTVVIRIPKKGLPEDRTLAKLTVRSLALPRLTRDFAQSSSWKIFGSVELLLRPVRPEQVVTEDSYDTPQFTVEAKPELYEKLALDAERLKKTNKAYDKAKDRLWDLFAHHTGPGFTDHAREIRALIAFLESCNRSSADSFMAGWYNEKMPRVRRAFDDLLQRKNHNHPGYKFSAEDAQGILYSYSAPFAYLETPPSTHQIEEYLN